MRESVLGDLALPSHRLHANLVQFLIKIDVVQSIEILRSETPSREGVEFRRWQYRRSKQQRHGGRDHEDKDGRGRHDFRPVLTSAGSQVLLPFLRGLSGTGLQRLCKEVRYTSKLHEICIHLAMNSYSYTRQNTRASMH